MEALKFEQTAIFTPNPTTKRAFRVKWSLKPNNNAGERIIAYGVGKNLVLRDLNNWRNTFIFNFKVLNDITCVRYNNIGTYLAVGDAAGNVKVLGWSDAERSFVTKWEREAMLPGGQINDIAWTDDHNKICVVGGGQLRAATVNIETGSKVGDIIGPSQTLLTVDIKKSRPFKCVLSGEDRELQVNKCPPFQNVKSI